MLIIGTAIVTLVVCGKIAQNYLAEYRINNEIQNKFKSDRDELIAGQIVSKTSGLKPVIWSNSSGHSLIVQDITFNSKPVLFEGRPTVEYDTNKTYIPNHASIVIYGKYRGGLYYASMIGNQNRITERLLQRHHRLKLSTIRRILHK